jgi:hypothetical protein
MSASEEKVMSASEEKVMSAKEKVCFLHLLF